MIPHFAGANTNRVRSYGWVTEHQDELVSKRVNAAQQMFATHEAEREAAGKGSDRPDAGRETSTSLS